MVCKSVVVFSCVLLAAALIGCEQQQSAGLDDGVMSPGGSTYAQGTGRILPPVEDAPDEDGGLNLAFWTWFGDDSAGQPPRVSEGQILGNLSPELSTRTHTPDEVDIGISKTFDHDGRAAWDDLRYHLMLDSPSRLSMTPTP